MEKSHLTFTVLLCENDCKVLKNILEVVKENHSQALNVLKPQSNFLYERYNGILVNLRWMLKPNDRGEVIVNLYELKKLHEYLASISYEMQVGQSSASHELFIYISTCATQASLLFDDLLNPLKS